uniref:AAA+ ATPase domain-containing protein n=1 Tax=Fagus sylvatica TaxID=28930 RepID=A0A2N9GFT7_FAGSY
MLGAAASGIGSAAASAVGTSVGDEVYKYGKELFHDVSRRVDNDLENNYERLIEHAEKLYARRDDILAQAKTKQAHSKGKFEIGMVVEKLPERVIIIHGPKIEDKPFLHSTIEEILGHLQDKNVKRIGLWGMAGIGKTTIMQNLNNNEVIVKMFDIVIWVTVSKDWSLEKLQHTIADRLKLNMEGITDRNEIAQQIRRELKSRRCLLLLDEVWEVLDLPLIGMYDNEKDSKVVLATRHRHVCYDMETDEEINVQRLSEASALQMFKVKVGRNVNLPGIEPIAKLVVNECAGLPLLIDKVASIFRRKDNFHLWNDGLRSLRRWPSIKIQGINELIDYLKFCYEDLDDEVKKVCFLYGAMYPEECEIYVDYLLECWRAEGFIHDANEFRDARGKGHSILDELINVSLLEKSAKMNHVRMNKVLRNMALNISSQSYNFKILVKPCEGLQEAPNERNRDLRVIPESFFGCMQNLRVLDLHGTGITSLPSSISCLKCLRALYLNSCICLMELCYLEGLKYLEVLDIRDTKINHFPIQIGHLIQLKCLRMSLSNFGIVEFRQNVFSSLSLLEELQIDVDPNNRSWEATVKAITKEVATLKHLTSLSICFPTVDCLQSFISASPLWKDFRFTFQFSVGYHDSTRYQILDFFEYQIRNCLKFANGEGVDPIISDVLLETDAFELIGHKGASRLSDFGIESINKMRGCLIEGCDEIETIVHCNSEGRSALECLEKMYINNVPKLESIWEGPIHAGSLARLTTLTLRRCLKLKKIFSNGMIEQLFKLEHLSIEECPEIEEIITESENNGLKPDALPRLKMVVLSDLPKVKSIWTDDSLKWPSLESIKISMCQMLTRLPFNSENAISLRCIEANQSWWSALVWQDDAIEKRLRSIWLPSSS